MNKYLRNNGSVLSTALLNPEEEPGKCVKYKDFTPLQVRAVDCEINEKCAL